MTRQRLGLQLRFDIHCQIDDGFALCGDNVVPRVPYDEFMLLGEALARDVSRGTYRAVRRCDVCAERTTLEDVFVSDAPSFDKIKK